MDYLCLFHFLEYLENLRNYFNVAMKLCGRVLTSALSEDSFAGSMSERMHNALLHRLTRCADRTVKELPLSFYVECPDVIHISFENQCHRRFCEHILQHGILTYLQVIQIQKWLVNHFF